MSARDVMIEALMSAHYDASDSTRADLVIEALTSAGYRIIGPGELDRETVERCDAEVESACEANASDHDVIRFIRKRIRSLKAAQEADDD